MSRTNIDWSKHELVVENDGKHTQRTSLAVPDSCMLAVHFINTYGVLMVTGDFGYWHFCRTFNPATDFFVGDSYFCEKAQISSRQTTHVYSSEDTRKAIDERITDILLDEFGEDAPHVDTIEPLSPTLDQLLPSDAEEIRWLMDCRDHVDEDSDGTRYMCFAHDNTPAHLDHESVICCKMVDPQLQAVLDAYEECGRRIVRGQFTTRSSQ